MGVYIKGMEMPTSCSECALNYDCFKCIVTGTPFFDHEHNFDDKITRLNDCPLVELPPHGRLIDADALEDRCSRQATDEWNKSTGTNWGYAYATFESDVEDAPTIIEAEEGE